MAGVFYLLMLLSGGIETFARRGLIVKADAAATAAGIMAHQPMWRLAYAADLFVVITYVLVVILFYRLLMVVNREVALAALAFGLIACAIQATAAVFLQAPVVVLSGAPSASFLAPPQLPALANLFLLLYSKVYAIAFVFFGCFNVATGWLTFRSTFLPRILGVMSMLAGLSWLVFLEPATAAKLLNPWLLIAGVGEFLLIVWLLLFGADAQKWREQAGRAP